MQKPADDISGHNIQLAKKLRTQTQLERKGPAVGERLPTLSEGWGAGNAVMQHLTDYLLIQALPGDQ